MHFQKILAALFVSTLLVSPNFASDADLLAKAIRSEISGSQLLEKILPADHKLINGNEISSFKDVQDLLDLAMKEDQAPEKKLLLLHLVYELYNALVPELAHAEELFGKFLQGLSTTVEVSEIKKQGAKFKESVDDLCKMGDELLEQTDALYLRQAGDACKKDLSEVPEDKQKLILGIERFRHSYSGLIAILQKKRIGVLDKFFNSALSTPQMCPIAANEYRVYILKIAHEYMEAADTEKATTALVSLDGICEALLGEITSQSWDKSKNEEMMFELLSPWKFDSFRQDSASARRKIFTQLHPAPIPDAALYFNWSRLHLKHLLKMEHPSADDIEKFYQKARKSAEIFETKDRSTNDLANFFSMKTITQGMSRSLAIEFLYLTLGQLENLLEKKLINESALNRYRNDICLKARALAQKMTFDKACGINAQHYQAVSYIRVAGFYQDPLMKYIWLMSAQNLYKKETSDPVYTDLLLFSGHSETIGRVFSQQSNKKKLSEMAQDFRSQAFEQAKAKAEALALNADNEKDDLDKAAKLCQARVFYSLANFIGQSESGLTTELQEIDGRIAGLFGQCIDMWKRQFAQIHSSQESASSVDILAKFSSLHSFIAPKIKEAMTTSRLYGGEYSVQHFGWDDLPHPAWSEVAKFMDETNKSIDILFRAEVLAVVDKARERAKTTTDPLVLAEEYAAELVNLKRPGVSHVPLWDKVGLVLELRSRPFLQAILQAKSVYELKDSMAKARTYLEDQRHQYPDVFNGFEELVQSELYSVNRVRENNGQVPLTREEFGEPQGLFARMLSAYGWTRDARVWLPTEWAKALNCEQNRFREAEKKFIKGYKPIFTRLDKQSLILIKDDIEYLKKISDYQFSQYFESVSRYLDAVIPVFEGVDGKIKSEQEYSKIVNEIGRAGIHTNQLVHYCYLSLLEVLNEEMLANCLGLPVLQCVNNLQSLKYNRTEKFDTTLKEQLSRKISHWFKESSEGMRQVYQRILLANSAQEQPALCDELLRLMDQFASEQALIMTQQKDMCRLNIRYIDITFPVHEFALPWKKAEIELIKANAEQTIFREGLTNKFEDLRGAANNLGNAETMREKKIAGYPKLKLQANELLNQITNSPFYRDDRKRTPELKKLKDDVDALISKLTSAIERYVK